MIESNKQIMAVVDIFVHNSSVTPTNLTKRRSNFFMYRIYNIGKKKYRYETFCYGPKSCPFYKAGPTRKVSGRKGMSWEEEDWVDEDATSHRSMDE